MSGDSRAGEKWFRLLQEDPQVIVYGQLTKDTATRIIEETAQAANDQALTMFIQCINARRALSLTEKEIGDLQAFLANNRTPWYFDTDKIQQLLEE
jgi:hypothetical protein